MNEEDSGMDNMMELAEKAVELAGAFECRLDYSMESLSSLDELAGMLHRMHTDEPLAEKALINASAILGAYLGETLLRNGLGDLGFGWVEEDGWAELGREEERTRPLSKVYKRITNGPGDDLTSFGMISLVQAGGKMVG